MTDSSAHGGYPPPPGTPPAQPPGWQPAQPPPSQAPPGESEADRLNRLSQWASSWGAREKSEGRAQVEREIAEKLGVTLDEAAEALKKAREADQATMTDAQKLMAQAQEAGIKADAATKAAHEMIYNGLREDALVGCGMTRDQARISRNMIHIDGDVTVESVVAAAQAVKVGFPQLFSETPPPPPGGNGAPSGGTDRQPGGPVDSTTRGGPPPSQGGGSTARERAQARLRQERGGRLRSDPVIPPPQEMDYRRNT